MSLMAYKLSATYECQSYKMRMKSYQRLADGNIRRALVKAISENFSSEHMAGRVVDL